MPVSMEETSKIWSPIPVASLLCVDGPCSLYPINSELKSAIILGPTGSKLTSCQMINSQQAEAETLDQFRQILTLSIPKCVHSILPSVDEHWKTKNAGIYWHNCLITGTLTYSYDDSTLSIIITIR